jgi:membrane carboxypeptidase/penicillin-binding protein
LTAGAWLGYDDEKLWGGGNRQPRRSSHLAQVHAEGARGKARKGFTAPDGLEFTKIDPVNGLLAGPATVDPVFEVFRTGTAPKEVSTARIKRTTDFFMMDSDSERPAEKAPETQTEDEEEPLD